MGGAFSSWGNDVIHDNEFYNNRSSGSNYAAGAIYCGSSSTLNIFNNKFYNNSSVNYGGGAIYCYSAPTISNNVFSNNSGPMGGAITYDGGVHPTLTNNTFMNNRSIQGGAIYCRNAASPNIVNCILWGDSATISGNEIYLADQNNGPNISYSDVKAGQSSIGLATNTFYLGSYSNNINTDPLVVYPSAGSGLGFDGSLTNLSLTGTSPCINAGNPSGTYPITDIAGNPRVFNSLIDIGAYELQGYFGILDNSFTHEPLTYPNPSTGHFTVRSMSVSDKMQVDLYDINGRQVLCKSVTGTSDIDATGLEIGAYTLKIKNATGVLTQKLIITR